MAAARLLRRRSLLPCCPNPLAPLISSRSLATTPPSSSPSRRRYPPPPPHDFTGPCELLGSWTIPPSDPREAETRLARLRREYARHVKQLRAEYAHDVELLRQEKQRRDDARREATRLANEQRKAAKAAAAQTRAAERRAFQEEFRQTLLKERAEKLESWRAKEEERGKRNKEKKDLLRQQSSIWIAEKNLERRILEAMVDTTPL